MYVGLCVGSIHMSQSVCIGNLWTNGFDNRQHGRVYFCTTEELCMIASDVRRINNSFLWMYVDTYMQLAIHVTAKFLGGKSHIKKWVALSTIRIRTAQSIIEIDLWEHRRIYFVCGTDWANFREKGKNKEREKHSLLADMVKKEFRFKSRAPFLSIKLYR